MTSAESLTRGELVSRARDWGIARPELMTRGELLKAVARAESGKAPTSSPSPGWFGVARELLASVIEQGLNLPDAASLIRGEVKLTRPPPAPTPVATVTLAQIYAAQGHPERAITTLRELLEAEPDHDEAAKLLQQLEATRGREEVTHGREEATQEPSPHMPEVEERLQAEAPKPARQAEAPKPARQAEAPKPARQAEAPKPPRDEPAWPLFIVVCQGTHCSAHWRFEDGTRALVRARVGEGNAMARVSFYTPSASGVECTRLERSLVGPRGQFSCEAPSAHSVVRAALGWLDTAGSFTPLAVAALATKRHTQLQLTWKPRSGFDEAQALAQIAEGSTAASDLLSGNDRP